MEKVKLKKSLLIIIVALFMLVFVSLTGIKDPIVGTWKVEAMMDGDAYLNINHLDSTYDYHFKNDNTGYVDDGESPYAFIWENTNLEADGGIYKIYTEDDETTCFLITLDSGEKKMLVHVKDEKYFVFSK